MLSRRCRFKARRAALAVLTGSTMLTCASAEESPRNAKVEALISQMTPEEKAAQITTTFSLPSPAAQKKLEDKAAAGAGSFLFVSDPRDANRLQRAAMERSRLKIPLLFGFDVIHGFATIFPVPIGMAASWDPKLAEDAQAVAAREARAVGIGWTFAPMVDVTRDARWGRIVEGAGEDPYLGAAMAAAQVRGFQGMRIGAPDRVLAGPKHFAGYGAAVGGRDYDEVNLSDSEFWNTYLPPFKAAIDAGAQNIMVAYMGLNGIPAAGNRWLLTDVLRGTFGFKGWTVSDAEGVNNLKTHGLTKDEQESAVRALSAGTDMEMDLFTASFAKLPQALAAGQVTEERLNEAVRRVLTAKMRLGLFEKPYVDEALAARALRTPASLDRARVAAERSAVLLRNEGALLPLDRGRHRSVALIGGLAESERDALGPWTFRQNAPATQTIRAGLEAKLGRANVTYSPGVSLPTRLHPSPFAPLDGVTERPTPTDDDSGIVQAVAATRAADVAVLVLGEAQDMIGESASRSTLSLPGRQQDLLDAVVATGKPVVVLLMNGRPLDLKDTKAQAILDIWYPGSRGGDAVANLLFGDAVPGGKLPFTWPRNVGQVPAFYARLASHEPRNADKRYWNETGAPAYPFGHGLSYSTFSFSDAKLDRVTVAAGESATVTVEVRNTGTRTADEVAQLYIHQRHGGAARPVRELKGFQRVTLKPGESRTLRFRVGPEEMRYWNAAQRDWVIDDTTFDLGVGGDSTARFSTQLTVTKP